ncbi:hypothetical protein ES703_40021 [subsurface metagenome]
MTDCDIRTLLNTSLGDKLSNNCSFWFADGEYYCSPLGDIDRLVEASLIDKQTYISEKYDCDDFALSLKHHFIRDAYLDGHRRRPHSLGIFWKPGHAMNIAVSDDGKVWIIEPQNDNILPPGDGDKGIYFIYF